MKKISILILEDNPETLSVIFKILSQLESEAVFYPIVLSTYLQVEELINKSSQQFDIILLDRDCALGGSFHILDINKFGIDKVIGISSVPPYNEELQKKGVKRIINKDFRNLKSFEDALFETLLESVIKS